jgi:hypothetical protein
MKVAFRSFLTTIENVPDDVRDQIVDGMARALFVSSWAEAHAHEYQQVDLEKVAPPTPPDAEMYARNLCGQVEKYNDRTDINLIYAGIVGYEAHAHRKKPTPESFGWYLGMQMLGHGVSWTDDHPDAGLELPYADYRHDEFTPEQQDG